MSISNMKVANSKYLPVSIVDERHRKLEVLRKAIDTSRIAINYSDSHVLEYNTYMPSTTVSTCSYVDQISIMYGFYFYFLGPHLVTSFGTFALFLVEHHPIFDLVVEPRPLWIRQDYHYL